MRGGAYLTLSAVFLAGCSGSPLGYLGATSPMAGPIASLGVGLLAMSIGVCVIVAILLWIAIRLLVALWRGRQKGGLPITPGNDRAAIRWIGVGVAISTVFLVGAAVWTLVTVRQIRQPALANVLSNDVTGQDWWEGQISCDRTSARNHYSQSACHPG